MGTPPFPPLEAEAARALVSRALPSAGARAAAPLAKAFGHQTYQVDAQIGPLMLKIARDAPEVARLRQAAAAAEAAWNAGVITPRVLAVGVDEAIGNRAFLVQTYLPGTDGEEAWGGLTPNQRLDLARAWGAAVAQLHGVVGAAFTEAAVPPSQAGDWSAHVAYRCRKLRGYHRRAGVLAPEDVVRALAEIEALAAATAPVVTPGLTHRDLCLRNTLASEGRFAGLLDFEHARYTDVVIDFVKLDLQFGEGHPDEFAAFREGYGPLPARAAERARAALGLELLGGIPYFARNRLSDALRDYQRRFEAWLRGGR